ncbi:MAG TPA: ATP-binding protein [Candidatus Acidoferrales bacterium]|nr:ATP-binding protein [Candidatus Acidoferrales bacterium]
MTLRSHARQAPKTDLKTTYESALRNYVEGAAEKDLVCAYELGQTAFAANVGILEIVSLHHSALVETSPRKGHNGDAERLLRLSGQFLAEVFATYELGRRAYGDTVLSLRHLNELLEQEVKRLAHTVHDEAGQLLVAAHLAIAEVMSGAKPEVQKRLREVTGLLHQAEDHLREFSHELRPMMLDDLGLVPALRSLAEGVSKRRRLGVEVASSFERRLPPAIEMGLYRVVQEALTNVTRHSRARHVKIKVQRSPTHVRCIVEDDGVGFDVDSVLSGNGKKCLGLIGIQERLSVLKGTFRVDSQLGRGSKLTIAVPLGD